MAWNKRRDWKLEKTWKEKERRADAWDTEMGIIEKPTRFLRTGGYVNLPKDKRQTVSFETPDGKIVLQRPKQATNKQIDLWIRNGADDIFIMQEGNVNKGKIDARRRMLSMNRVVGGRY